MIEGLLKKSVRDLVPYTPKNYVVDIKLDANENNHVALQLNDKIAEALKGVKINHYPDSDSTVVRQMIADDFNININQVILGCGSDQIITLIINAFIDPEDKILIHTPTFDMYRITNKIAGGKTLEVPLGNDFEFDCKNFINVMEKEQPKIVFMTNPNNPTGGVIAKEDIIEITKKAKGIVVVDEAYMEFFNESAVDLVDKYPNLMVLRTLSKAFGLAGARIGYSIASEVLTKAVNRVKPPYNVSSIDQVAAKVCLENKSWAMEIIDDIIKEREVVSEALKALGLKVFDSEANFILFKMENAKGLYEYLLENKILIRYFGETGPLAGCLRMSIGTPEENKKVLRLIGEFL
ncbi:histidinol-phosphate transaminase [Serpentinicella sp. ANB-PHB4]|uniref:histidinol-phosphate transaminase n=1 Tax=Serpentinicella sp. ANB-PHB4 TaxID=3074076 RepID=UPI0028673111|nr:histidinol-phosphate transaminase [Serpentinicella sp. ANB-PHB4]MDR5659755.1 histidinol-phosphate transaminase [Serpentinicella sp. ANB-PHB4]